MRPHDLPGQPQCGLRLLEPGKSPLYSSALCRAKRTHIANQMKRVQRVEDSLAQSGARPQCGFHISPQRTPRGKHYKANAVTQKRTLPRRRLRSPSTAFPRAPSGSPPENAQARNEPTKPDNRTGDPRTRYQRSRPTAE